MTKTSLTTTTKVMITEATQRNYTATAVTVLRRTSNLIAGYNQLCTGTLVNSLDVIC